MLIQVLNFMIEVKELKVSSIHIIKYWEYGNPNGFPLISLHGGPGSKSNFKHIQHFDFDKFRLIQFDQRGAGQSEPLGEIKENTTQDLINDIEKLRKHLGLKKFFLKGGSWGATLALLYAEAYPQNLEGLLLSSVFLARKTDYEWIENNNVEHIIPERKKWLESLKNRYSINKDKVIEILLDKELDPESKIARVATAYYAVLEGMLVGLDPLSFVMSIEEIAPEDVYSAKIALHYFQNKFFINENQILDNAHRISEIPTFIGHSRYDMVCPYEQAYTLNKHLKNSYLYPFVNYSHLGGASINVAQNNFAKLILDKKSDD